MKAATYNAKRKEASKTKAYGQIIVIRSNGEKLNLPFDNYNEFSLTRSKLRENGVNFEEFWGYSLFRDSDEAMRNVEIFLS